MFPGVERDRRGLQSSSSDAVPRRARSGLWCRLSGQTEDSRRHLSQRSTLTTTCRPRPRPPYNNNYYYYYTRLTALCLGLPGWAGTRNVKPIWILLKQETLSGSGISWASLQTDNHASNPPLSFFTGRMPLDFIFQPTASKHWRQV